MKPKSQGRRLQVNFVSASFPGPVHTAADNNLVHEWSGHSICRPILAYCIMDDPV